MSQFPQKLESGKIAEAVTKDKAADVGQNLLELGHRAQEAVSEKVEALRGQAEEFYEQGKEKATQWEQSIEDFIREKPLPCILIAAGVGMVLAVLWKRS